VWLLLTSVVEVESQQASGFPLYQPGLHRGAFVFMHGASRFVRQTTRLFSLEVNTKLQKYTEIDVIAVERDLIEAEGVDAPGAASLRFSGCGFCPVPKQPPPIVLRQPKVV